MMRIITILVFVSLTGCGPEPGDPVELCDYGPENPKASCGSFRGGMGGASND